jgi:hypothetical protein
MSYGKNDQLRNLGETRKFFSVPQSPDRLWGPQFFLSNVYLGFFPGDEAA